jgi:hypothetical protein
MFRDTVKCKTDPFNNKKEYAEFTKTFMVSNQLWSNHMRKYLKKFDIIFNKPPQAVINKKREISDSEITEHPTKLLRTTEVVNHNPLDKETSKMEYITVDENTGVETAFVEPILPIGIERTMCKDSFVYRPDSLIIPSLYNLSVKTVEQLYHSIEISKPSIPEWFREYVIDRIKANELVISKSKYYSESTSAKELVDIMFNIIKEAVFPIVVEFITNLHRMINTPPIDHLAINDYILKLTSKRKPSEPYISTNLLKKMKGFAHEYVELKEIFESGFTL